MALPQLQSMRELPHAAAGRDNAGTVRCFGQRAGAEME